MQVDTPRFCQTTENNLDNHNLYSFSNYYQDTINSQDNSKDSNNNHKSKSKNKRSKSKDKSKLKKKYNNLENINYHSDKINTQKYNILQIHDFLVKNKFKISNRFDQINSEKFLSSKEEALRKPFFLFEE